MLLIYKGVLERGDGEEGVVNMVNNTKTCDALIIKY